MDYRDTPDEHMFRTRLRRWLATNAPQQLPADPDERMMALNHWHQKLYTGGWIGLTFPQEYGGHGMAPIYEAILNDELGLAGAPPPPAIGHISNAIRLFGTDAQKHEYLPPLLASTTRWCQGFSEPNAGSDLAGITTRAERTRSTDRSDVYRIYGQKIWTSEAAWADWCLLLCRTEFDQPARAALSMLLVPMSVAGLECRDILTAYGTREFAELFFDGSEIPASNVLGEPGTGWTIAMQLLGYERGPADVGWIARLARTLTLLEADIRSGRVVAGPSERRDLSRAWVELRTLQLQVQRTMSARADGSTPGAEGSIDKLMLTRTEQLLNHVNLQLRGSDALLNGSTALESYFWSRAQSIFGGTQQIQRNIVAQRVLRLPRP
jgi:alkylation response protein AidB-like acyl-CoA dehydrogenase